MTRLGLEVTTVTALGARNRSTCSVCGDRVAAWTEVTRRRCPPPKRGTVGGVKVLRFCEGCRELLK